MASLIIYIHGTYAATGSVRGLGAYGGTEGEKNAIKKMVSVECGGGQREIQSFYWSGGDTFAERREWAAKLQAVLEIKKRNELILVTHSHGGNVAGHALSLAKIPVQAVYLFACPIMTGDGKAWWKKGVKSIDYLHTFSTPNDTIQVTGASARNSADWGVPLGYSVGWEIEGVQDISLQAKTGYMREAHGWMHTEEAFEQACGKLKLI